MHLQPHPRIFMVRCFMNRKLKKLLLQSQLLSIDEQDIQELDQKYIQEFNKDFHEELKHLKNNEKNIVEKPQLNLVSSRTLKKMHRKLARATHPDINEKNLPFTKVQEAYESGDSGKLLSIAADLNVDIGLSEKEVIALTKQLREKQEKLKKTKNTVRWVWCTSNKSDELKIKIRDAMGITPEAWEEIKKN